MAAQNIDLRLRAEGHRSAGFKRLVRDLLTVDQLATKLKSFQIKVGVGGLDELAQSAKQADAGLKGGAMGMEALGKRAKTTSGEVKGLVSEVEKMNKEGSTFAQTFSTGRGERTNITDTRDHKTKLKATSQFRKKIKNNNDTVTKSTNLDEKLKISNDRLSELEKLKTKVTEAGLGVENIGDAVTSAIKNERATIEGLEEDIGRLNRKREEAQQQQTRKNIQGDIGQRLRDIKTTAEDIPNIDDKFALSERRIGDFKAVTTESNQL